MLRVIYYSYGWLKKHVFTLNQEIVITKGVSLSNKHDYTKSHARHKDHEREKRKQLKARATITRRKISVCNYVNYVAASSGVARILE